jgi:nucleoid DNA-binding protein
VATVVSALSFPALPAALRDAVEAGELKRVQSLVDGFHEQMMEALDAGDRVRLAELGGQAARLQTVVQSAGSSASEEVTQALVGDLRRVARTVEIGWTWPAMQGSRHQPTTPKQFTVRERVLAALRDEPQRPRDLAARLHVDRTQVSRALRQLEPTGRVKTAAPAGGEARRAVYWRAS